MEKFLKRIRTIAILLISILISVIAFTGVYSVKNGVWTNSISDFNFGMEIKGIRELRFVLDDSEEEKEVYVDSEGNVCGEVVDNESTSGGDTEISLVEEETTEETTDETQAETAVEEAATEETAEATEDDITANYTKETRTIKANEDSSKNIDNFEKTKRIIQKRLESNSSYEYNIRLNEQNGEIVLEVPNNDEIDKIESLVTTVGKIEITDYQNGLVLLDGSGLKNAVSTYTTTESGYQAYLILTFNKEAAEKLREISTKYVAIPGETEDDEETIKYITLKLDGQTILQTYFGQELSNGVVQIPMGNATEDVTEFRKTLEQVTEIAQILRNERLPLTYKLSSDNYINSSITDEFIMIAKIVGIALVVIISAYLIIRYKLNGLKAAILSCAYIGLLSVIIKYTNVIMTVNAIIAFVGVIIINYIFVNKMLKKVNQGTDLKIAFMHSMKEVYLTIVPICIIAIIFTFMYSTIINSIGMVLFWGLFIEVIIGCALMLVLNEKNNK